VRPRRSLAGLLALLFSYFAVFSLVLTVLPFSAEAAAMPPVAVGAVLAVFGGLGLVVEPVVGALANRVGRRAVIRVGGMVGAAGALVPAVRLDEATVLVFALSASVAACCIVNPALSALSAQGDDRQARIQGVNAAVQRLGSLLAAGALALLLTEERLPALHVLAAVCYLAVAACAGAIAPPVHDGPPRGRAGLRTAYSRSYSLALTSPGIARGALVNAGLTLFFLLGSSFYPLLVLERGDGPGYVGLALGMRDAVAVVAGPFFAAACRRFTLRRVWPAAAAVGLATLLGSVLVEAPLASGLLFAGHGAAIGLGIAATNLHVTEATTERQRVFGFAATSLASRLVNLVVPLALGSVLGFASVGWAMGVGLACGTAALAAYLAVGRSRTRPAAEVDRLEVLSTSVAEGRAS
jgi:hypothetical protein